MKNLIGLGAVIVLVFGCDKKSEEAPAPPAPAPTGSAHAPAPPAPPMDAPSAGGDYDSHLKAGVALEDHKEWRDALAEFEAALAARPDDARALTEVGFTAYFAGKLDRAREASTAAVLAGKDGKLRGAALFNLGLAVEHDLPNAAASLYIASIIARPSPAVRARLAKLRQNKAASTPSADGDALLAKLDVKRVELPVAKPNATPEDQAMMAALEAAGIEWDSGAGKSVLLVEHLQCSEDHKQQPIRYECTTPAAKGQTAKAIVESLVAHKLDAVKGPGGVVAYEAASVRCRSFNEGDSGQPDACEVTAK
jgi:tetratricopeptide (TPR) repeat protein